MKVVCKCGFAVEGDDLEALEGHFAVSDPCAELGLALAELTEHQAEVAA